MKKDELLREKRQLMADMGVIVACSVHLERMEGRQAVKPALDCLRSVGEDIEKRTDDIDELLKEEA